MMLEIPETAATLLASFFVWVSNSKRPRAPSTSVKSFALITYTYKSEMLDKDDRQLNSLIIFQCYDVKELISQTNYIRELFLIHSPSIINYTTRPALTKQRSCLVMN